MDEEYDVIVVGTGLTECILSGVLSAEGKKVLHMDRNDYYGGASASLDLTRLYKRFKPECEKPAEKYGRDRDWNVDIIPKFMMADGELVKILIHTDVTRYIEFKEISGSYVARGNKIGKVPATEDDAVRTDLVNWFEKPKLKKFLEFLQKWKDDDPSTHQGFDMDGKCMRDLYDKFGLKDSTREFVGHAMALYFDESYLDRPARETHERIILYVSSVTRYGVKSPYIYPLYGLGELPQGFARLSAIYGGTYMLDKPVDEIVYGPDGKVCGVRSGEETAKTKAVIGDPSYFHGKVRKVGQVVRAICILKHPIDQTEKTMHSVQIIIPQQQANRKHDIYIVCMSSVHNVCAKDHYLAIVSTIVETDDPVQELEAGLKFLGEIDEKFVYVADLEEPCEDGRKDNIYISRSYDATSHFESVCTDVKDIYKRLTGNDLKIQPRPKAEEE